MLNDVYSNRLLEAAGNISRTGRLAAPDASATKTSRVCGSEMTVDLVLDKGFVTDFALVPKACALGQAAASLVARHIVGATADELRVLREQMLAMLKEKGAAPVGERWAELTLLAPICDYPTRHASTMLVFEAIIECLDQIETEG